MTRVFQRIGLASFLVLAVGLFANLPAPGQDKKPPDKKDKKVDKKSDDKGEEKPEPKKEPEKLDTPLVTLKAHGDLSSVLTRFGNGKRPSVPNQPRQIDAFHILHDQEV